MPRNRQNFNKKPNNSLRFTHGNVLTMEERRLVEKQKELLRNMSFNQGVASASNQGLQMTSPLEQLSLFPSLGNVLPAAAALLPNMLSASNMLKPAPLMSQVMVPSPLMGSSPSMQVAQSSLISGRPPNNSFYDNLKPPYQSRNIGGYQAQGFRKNAFNNRKRDNTCNEQWNLLSQDSDFDRSYSSNYRLEKQNWNKRGSRSFEDNSEDNWTGRPWKDKTSSNGAGSDDRNKQNEESRYGKRQPSSDSRENRGKRPREDDNNWSDDEKDSSGADRFHDIGEEYQTKKHKTFDGSWKRGSQDTEFEEEKRRLSLSDDEDEKWDKETSSCEDNKMYGKKNQCEEGSSRVNSDDEKRCSSERDWRDKSHSRDRDWLPSSTKNKSNLYKEDESNDSSQSLEKKDTKDSKDEFDGSTEKTWSKSKMNKEGISAKNFFSSRKSDNDNSAPSKFSYHDAGLKPQSDISSRHDSFNCLTFSGTDLRGDGNREHSEEALIDGGKQSGWEGLKTLPTMSSVNETSLQMQMGYLQNQLLELEERKRLFQIESLANISDLRSNLWDNQSLWTSDISKSMNLPETEDLRVLLLNKARAAGMKTGLNETDQGGWNENMVLIYPFVRKIRFSQSNIIELRTELSNRIHLLLSDNAQDIQPRFLGTGKVCRNWFMVHCADQQSVDWLLTWKPQLKSKKRLRLCVQRAIDAVKVTHISIFLEGIKESIRDIELRLTHQNPHLEPHMWRRGGHTFSKQGTTVSFLVDAATLKLFTDNSWEVYYELTKFKVAVIKHDPIIPLVYTN